MKDRTAAQREAYVIAGFKVVFSTLGPIGSILTESIEMRERLKQQRFNEFTDGLIKYSESISDANISMPEEKKEAFAELFENIINSVIRSSSKSRRARFRNILCNSTIELMADLEESQRFVRITERLTEVQVMILMQFLKSKDRPELIKNKGNIEFNSTRKISGQFQQPNHVQLREVNERLATMPEPDYHGTYGLDHIDYSGELKDLIATGLVFEHEGGYRSISNLGERYVRFILDPEIASA